MQSKNGNGQIERGIKLVAFFVLLFTCSVANAEADYISIKGTVVTKDNRPLEFATVYLQENNIATTTNAKGQFILNAPQGNYTLTVTNIGFETYQEEICTLNMPNKSINVVLSEKHNKIEGVEVKGHGKSTLLKQSGFAVTSIDTKSLQAKSTEINDVLDRVPGLRVRRDGGLGSRTRYNINGLSGQAVRIFIDGVPAESFGSAYSINSIPISMIERIDVYKGVVPIEFGNDAMGGVINIVSKQAHRGMLNKSLNLSYSYGSFNTHRADVTGSWRDKKTGITSRLAAFYNHSDNNYWVWSDEIKIKDYNEFLPDGSRNPNFLSIIEQGTKVRRFNDAYRSYGAKFDIGITQKKWADQFFISINLASDYKESQHGPRMITPYGERFSKGQTIAQSLSYKKRNILKGLDLSANVQYSLSERSLVDTTTNRYDWFGNLIPKIAGVTPLAGESGQASLNIDNNSNIISRVLLSYNINDNNKLSFSYSNNLFIRSSDNELAQAEERNYGSKNSVNKQITGATYQNTSFNNRLRTSVFAKHYQNTLKQNRVEYNSGVLDTINLHRPDSDWGFGATLSFKACERIRINASAEKALRMVSVNEIFGNVAEEIVESVNLEAEQSTNANLGLIVKLLETPKNKLELNTNAFYRNTRDRIRRSVVVRNDDSYSVFNNIGQIISKGIEAQIDYSMGNKWHFMLQGYYLDSRFMNQYAQDGSINLNYLSREPNMPWLTASASANYQKENVAKTGDKLSLGWYTSYIYEFNFDWDVIGNQNKPIIPAQLINDISLTYTFSKQKLSISLDGKNLFNELSFDNYAIQKPGRAFYMKMTYQIF